MVGRVWKGIFSFDLKAYILENTPAKIPPLKEGGFLKSLSFYGVLLRLQKKGVISRGFCVYFTYSDGFVGAKRRDCFLGFCKKLQTPVEIMGLKITSLK